MATVTLKGTPFSTSGSLPATGSVAPALNVVKNDLSALTTAALAGSRVILNIFPSIDTPTCATSVRRFNKEAAGIPGTQVVCISHDLPFALKRFCGAEGLTGVTATSAFRSTFGKDFGLTIVDGPLAGLLARAVVVLDAKGVVLHSELVGEIANEPDYAKALAAAQTT